MSVRRRVVAVGAGWACGGGGLVDAFMSMSDTGFNEGSGNH